MIPLVPPMRERFTSRVDSVTVEQDGPVRAVVRIRGVHGTAMGSRTWLPFDVRLYFGAGTTPVRMVHSIIYDGDQNQDFIRGMGVVFDVPMREQIHNRHVRFGGLGYMALGCVVAGFGYFFLSDIANALGASGAVPVMLAAWAPPMAPGPGRSNPSIR